MSNTISVLVEIRIDTLPTKKTTNTFVKSDDGTTIIGYEGPVVGKYLMKWVSKKNGIGRFKTLKEAVEEANRLGDECGGITMQDNAYILQKGNEFITPPENHRALPENQRWLAWRKETFKKSFPL